MRFKLQYFYIIIQFGLTGKTVGVAVHHVDLAYSLGYGSVEKAHVLAPVLGQTLTLYLAVGCLHVVVSGMQDHPMIITL